MKFSVSALLLMSASLHAAVPANSVVSHDNAYYTHAVRNTQLIFSEENLPFATLAAKIELSLQPLYEDVFGYQMDEILYVALGSQHNQITNGFSTQFPNNRQINYIGGALAVDFFSSTSWLKTLLYHESAHNYQLNAKGSSVSRGLHAVIGNGSLLLPWIVLPNIVESPFLLEGNAVLNESWHGNGGRLYSGRFKAALLQQAKAGYLLPERVYNDNLEFLYGSHFYTLGGHYQYFLAENYGLHNTNSYWLQHSANWVLPFMTNVATQQSIGVDFNTAFAAWREHMQAEATAMIDVAGEALASTQFYSFINANADEIYFIINESGRGFPELVVYDKASTKLTRSAASFHAGKVIKLADARYVTQASDNTSPWRIHAGLYDDAGFIVEGTQSRVVEGYLSDGRAVYFDVPRSYDQPQLFVGDEFYAQVNSSVLISAHDDLYYFVQGDNKQRTLYKNRQALFTIKGFYSHVIGVDSRGAVYFIANSAHGSSLYRYDNGKLTRAHGADTIFDARLINEHSALVAVMGADAYSFKQIELREIDAAPYEVSLFFENAAYYRAADPELHAIEIAKLTLDDAYSSLLDMHYSGTNLGFANDEEAGFVYDISAVFSDALTQNQLSLFALRNTDEVTLGGISYGNNQYFVRYSLSAYAVIDQPALAPTATDRRDNGIIANASLPFIDAGHYTAALRASYFEDYVSNSRTPRAWVLDVRESEHYGVSFYRNFLLHASPYTTTDRGDTSNGGVAAFEYGFANEFYVGINGQASHSDATTTVNSRGVKLTDNEFDRFKDSDPATVVMPGLKHTLFFSSVSKAGLQLKQVFNLSKYYFVFPGSLRREAVYLNFNAYQLEPFASAEPIRVKEAILGINFDTLWVNRLPIPISLEYIHSDNATIAERNSVRLTVAAQF